MISSKRLVLIGINYAPEMTGIAPYTTELAEHFAKAGHSVRVVTGLPHYPEWRRLPIPPRNGQKNPLVARYHHFVPRRANALGRMLYEVTWLLSASRSLLAPGADAIIGVVPSLSGGLLALLWAQRWNAPVGLVVKDLMGPAASQSGYRGGGAVAGITGKIERLVLRRADRVAIISNGFRRYLMDCGVSGDRISCIRDWTHPGKASESREAYRRRLGWSDDDFICVHAGNMGKKQGLDNVLDAASLIQGRGVRIILAGDGNDRARLIERARRLQTDNVTFLSLQPPGLYEAMLRAADVLLLNQRPSVAEMSLPSKLASYLAAGRPIVAAVAETSPSAIEVRQAAAGVVVDPASPQALAHAVMELKANPALVEDLGRRGKVYAETNLTQQRSLQLYDEFLEDLADLRQAGRRPSRQSV